MSRLGALLILALLVLPVQALAGDGSGCDSCHNASGEGKLKFDTEKFQGSNHGFLTCTDCHEKFSGESFHFPPEGEVTPAVQKVADEIAQKAKADPVAQAACIKCHGDIYDVVLGSVHGENIVQKGESDGPLCVDCHGSPHYITSVSDEGSPVNHANVVDTCGTCHARKDIAEKYGIESNVTETYEESFHGRKHHLGHMGAPTCVSCHGAHDMKRGDDPASPVFGANKIKTCDKCHPGANEKFVPAITHEEVGPIPHYSEKGLILLVIGTIGFVLLHFILEGVSDIRDSLFRRKSSHEESSPDDSEEMERFNIHFRIQHMLLFTSFLVLAFTGWGLKYADVEQSHWLIGLSGGAEMAGIIHRVAGIIMVSTFLYHILYMAYLILSGKLKWRSETTVVPILKDAQDLIQNFRYYLGASDEQARYGRFNYKQKFDYWAVFWGMAIIGSSGVALAFPIAASKLIPEFTTSWIWQMISIMHSDEALLAVVFILFWHFYNEHLKPETFPMSWVWLTGKLTRKEMKHHHPIEYELREYEKKK